MKRFITLAIIIIPLISISQPTKEQIRQVEEARKEVKKMKGEPFPAFELTTLDGISYTNEDLKGKILLVNFWFSSCKPCIMEMPEMNEMVAEFKNEEVVFLAPTFDEVDKVNKFLKRRKFDYQIVSDVKEFCLELNVRSYPTHFVINQEGLIEKVVIGYSSMTVGALRRSVRKLLKSE